MSASSAPSPASSTPVSELAFAKLNLILHVGRARPDGLHPLCSLFASVDLADLIELRPAAADLVRCPGVDGPNLALAALGAFRERAPLPPLEVSIHKRIPVAAGLGGGSADAAAVLRGANAIAGRPLSPTALRELGALLGSDVPSQIEPCHALVQGVGERVAPIELPPLAAVLVPSADGLSTGAVYAELDRRGEGRAQLDPEPLRHAAAQRAGLADALENDLQPAALALRPELRRTLAALREAGARGVAVSGSGPTCFGLFDTRAAAERVATRLPGALAVSLRPRDA